MPRPTEIICEDKNIEIKYKKQKTHGSEVSIFRYLNFPIFIL